MRYGTEHKANSRQRILQAASQQVRRQGPGKVAVAEVMSAAGLTHGAFYAHFASKEALVAEAVDTMFGDAQRRVGGLAEALADDAGDVRAALRDHLASYLSPRHRDEPERGCPLPALSAEMARSNGQARATFVQGLERMTARIDAALARIGRDEPAADARTVVAQMVGAVTLARAVGSGAQSDAILRDNFASLVAKLDL